MTGFELVAGVIAVFFCCGIVLGVLAVISLGQGGRGRGRRHRRLDRYDKERTDPLGRYGWEEPPGPEDDDNPPRWPGRRG